MITVLYALECTVCTQMYSSVSDPLFDTASQVAPLSRAQVGHLNKLETDFCGEKQPNSDPFQTSALPHLTARLT